jgi:uncharacterized repeat protein (TIGR03833 family)
MKNTFLNPIILIGLKVEIQVESEDASNKSVTGIVAEIMEDNPSASGIKVKLETGQVGRIKNIL